MAFKDMIPRPWAGFSRGRRGSMLLMTLIFMVALTVAVTAFLDNILYSNRAVDAQMTSAQAFYAAESGLSHAMHYLLSTAPDSSTGGTWRTTAFPAAAGTGANDPRSETLIDGSYTMWAETSGSNIKLTARGGYGTSVRTVQQKVTLGSRDLVAWWKLNEGSGTVVHDFSGNGYDSTGFNGSPAWFTKDGWHSGLTFDGSNWIDFGTILQGAYDNITLSLWVKGTTLEGEDILERGVWDQPDAVAMATDGVTPYACFGHDGGIGGACSDPVTVWDGQWHHVVGTLEKIGAGWTYKYYVDGSLASSVPEGTGGMTAGSDLHWTLGARDGGSRGYNGQVSDVRIYKRTLTAGEVKTLYDNAGLEAWWRMDDAGGVVAVDAGDNHYDAALVNSPSWRNGAINGALSLNGSDQCGTVSSALSVQGSNRLTLAGWIYPWSFAAYNALFYTNSTNVWRLQTLTADDIGEGFVRFGAGDGNYMDSTAAIPLDQWTHLAGTFDGTYLKIYINGVLDSAVEQPATIADSDIVKVLGAASADCSGQGVNGSLDDLRVYSRDLSSEEIWALYKMELANGLVGWWKMDEGSGSSTADASNNGNAGTLVSGPTWVVGSDGSALTFNGTSQYIEMTNVVQPTTAVSVSAWVKPSSVPEGLQSIAGTWDDVSGDYRTYLLSLQSGTAAFYASSDGGGVPTAVGTTMLESGIWYHLTGTFDGTNIRIYVNGVLEATTYSPGGIATNPYPFYIGGMNAGGLGGRTYFPGVIDDVRLYTRALSAYEVQELHEAKAPTGITGWWKLDEASGTSFADSSGNTHTGTGGNTPSHADGISGQALSFNGTSQYVSVTGVAQPTTAVSVSAWVKPVDVSGVRPIAGTWDDLNSGPGINFGHRTYLLGVLDGRVGFAVSFNNPLSTAAYSSTTLATGNWYYLTGTFDGTDIKIYVNGHLEAAVNSPGVITTNSYPFYIGRANVFGDMNYFSGGIDDVRLYDRALSIDEIRSMYAEKVSSGLLAWWRLDEGSGTTAADSSQNGHTGTLTNGPVRVSGPQAVSFDGVDDYVGASDTGFPSGSAPRTITAWINTAESSERYFFHYGSDASGATYSLGVYSGNAFFTQWGQAVFGNVAVNDSKWHHVAVADDGSTQTLYVDGVADSSGSLSIDTVLNGSATIGGWPSHGDSLSFPGSVYDVRVYDRVLSVNEIVQLYEHRYSLNGGRSALTVVAGSWKEL